MLFLPNAQFVVTAKLSTQEEKEAELDDLEAYNMDDLDAYMLEQLA